jgi:hypothetical protein
MGIEKMYPTMMITGKDETFPRNKSKPVDERDGGTKRQTHD